MSTAWIVRFSMPAPFDARNPLCETYSLPDRGAGPRGRCDGGSRYARPRGCHHGPVLEDRDLPGDARGDPGSRVRPRRADREVVVRRRRVPPALRRAAEGQRGPDDGGLPGGVCRALGGGAVGRRGPVRGLGRRAAPGRSRSRADRSRGSSRRRRRRHGWGVPRNRGDREARPRGGARDRPSAEGCGPAPSRLRPPRARPRSARGPPVRRGRRARPPGSVVRAGRGARGRHRGGIRPDPPDERRRCAGGDPPRARPGPGARQGVIRDRPPARIRGPRPRGADPGTALPRRRLAERGLRRPGPAAAAVNHHDVVIAEFVDPWEARLARHFLEDYGIDARLEDAGPDRHLTGEGGRVVRLIVPADDADEAHVLLAEMTEEDHEPEQPLEVRRPLWIPAVALLVLVGLLLWRAAGPRTPRD